MEDEDPEEAKLIRPYAQAATFLRRLFYITAALLCVSGVGFFIVDLVPLGGGCVPDGAGLGFMFLSMAAFSFTLARTMIFRVKFPNGRIWSSADARKIRRLLNRLNKEL